MAYFNRELDTNMRDSLNFSDRKYHYSRPDQSEDEASDVMEYKFLRLREEETDYSNVIVALKGYQFGTHARPISIPKQGSRNFRNRYSCVSGQPLRSHFRFRKFRHSSIPSNGDSARSTM